MTTEPVACAFRHALQTSNSQGTALCPLIPAGACACVTVEAMIQGCHALTMIDTGSTGNFIGPAFVTVTHLHMFPLEQQLTLQLGCVGSCSCITHGARAPLTIKSRILTAMTASWAYHSCGRMLLSLTSVNRSYTLGRGRSPCYGLLRPHP